LQEIERCFPDSGSFTHPSNSARIDALKNDRYAELVTQIMAHMQKSNFNRFVSHLKCRRAIAHYALAL
jgi:hypothetical protein